MAEQISTKLLIGRQTIMDYLGGISKTLFYNFVSTGMPARNIDGRWYAHTENIDDFFKVITSVNHKGKPIPVDNED